MGKIVALGGGVFMGRKEDQFPASMDATHKEILALTGKKHPDVLYIPTACPDSEDHIKLFREYYTRLGCNKVEVLRLISETPSKEEIQTKILAADAIYVCGGNTYRALATWRRYGVDVLLKQVHRQGTVMAGHSAGAICWFAYGNSDSFYKKKPFRVTAVGIFNALLCPHYDSEPVRQPALKKMMRTYGKVAIALDEYAAIEIVDDNYRILTADPKAKVRRTYWKDGEYIIEYIKPAQKFQSLKQLLQKG